jgi:hypothetical protein
MFVLMAVALLSMPARADSVAPCLPPGVTGWECAYDTAGANILGSAAIAVERCRSRRAVALGVADNQVTVTSVTWSGSSYAVVFNNGATTVRPYPSGSLSGSDPLAYALSPYKCTTTPQEESCAATPPAYAKFQYSGTITGQPLACKSGCELTPATRRFVGVSKQAGTPASGTYEVETVLAPTGKTCGTDTSTLVYIEGDAAEENRETCRPSGQNLSTCFNAATRQMCVITPRGAKGCWTPTDMSTKVSPDQTESLAKAVAPTVPTAPTGLVNAETNQVAETTPGTSTTSSSTVIYNIQYANQRGQAGTGSDAGGEGDGEGGTCDGTGDCTNAGTPGMAPGAGEFYTPSGKTFGGVFTDYKASIEDAPIVAAASGVFTVTIPAGSCPVLSRPAWTLLGHEVAAVSFDWHCSGAFLTALQAVGYFLVILASWAAFRIAFL